MVSNTKSHPEAADAQKVDAAIELLHTGDLDGAERLLMAVIANTPAQYSNVEEDDEAICIKFWDQNAFVHFVTWQQEQAPVKKNINWIGNAYPRAFFYLGFIAVKRKEFTMALGFLDKGQSLEPTNPMFVYEKAQAMVYSRRLPEALALYDQIPEISAHVSAHHLAAARRGRGFVLIEMDASTGRNRPFDRHSKLTPATKSPSTNSPISRTCDREAPRLIWRLWSPTPPASRIARCAAISLTRASSFPSKAGSSACASAARED